MLSHLKYSPVRGRGARWKGAGISRETFSSLSTLLYDKLSRITIPSIFFIFYYRQGARTTKRITADRGNVTWVLMIFRFSFLFSTSFFLSVFAFLVEIVNRISLVASSASQPIGISNQPYFEATIPFTSTLLIIFDTLRLTPRCFRFDH